MKRPLHPMQMSKLHFIIWLRNFVGANSNVVNTQIFFYTELNYRWSSRNGIGGYGRAAPYVHGSGPDGSGKYAGVPERTVRKSGRDLLVHFRKDLNCRVHSRGESGTVGTGYPFCVSSWADRNPEILRGTRTDRKKKWVGLSPQTDTHTHTHARRRSGIKVWMD